MWTLSGPFDGETVADTSFTKVKLVKPGCKYTLGRKERPLVINHKKISRDHIVFEVGEYTEEDAETPERTPSLKLHNVGSANRKYQRGQVEMTLDRGSSVSLQDGDIVSVLHDVLVTVKWERVVCYCPPEQNTARPNVRDCAKLGLCLVWKPHAEVTHHLTTTYSLTPAIATSLMAKANIVKPDWLEAVLRSGSSSDGPSALEQEFVLPPPAKFRPGFSSSLPSSLKNYRSWEPNNDRINMLDEYRVIFVGERGREAKEELRELVRRGGATYECCPAQGGRKALHDVLAKAESKGKQPTLIADETALLAALGQKGWDELVNEAASYELRFIHADKLTQAVIHIDRSYLDCSMGKTSNTVQSVPDVILNTNPDEPSVPPATNQAEFDPESIPPACPSAPDAQPIGRKLVRRTGSKTPSRALSPSRTIDSQTEAGTSSKSASLLPPSVEEQKEEGTVPTRPRRLVRRFGRGATPIVGVDDPSADGDDSVISNRAASKEPEESAPLFTQSRSSRLKRRFGPNGQRPPSQTSPIFSTPAIEEEEEPPLKKYKALFEETDPDRIAQSGMEEYMNMYKDNGSHEETQDIEAGAAKKNVSAAAPEGGEEGTQTQMKDRIQASKRKFLDSSGDVEMEDAEDMSRNAKRRAVQTTQVDEPQSSGAVSHPPPRAVSKSLASKMKPEKSQKHSGTGAAPGKPDKDEQFLKAVASTKRGKKHEDEFDREFNNLKISKPDLQQDKVVEEWAVLTDFGDDENLRGNFMVVVEMDVFKKDDTPRNAMRVASNRADWDGRVNFKKFKQKATGGRREPIELIVDEDTYSEDEDTDPFNSHKHASFDSPAPAERLQRRSTSHFMDSDDELALPKLTRRNTRSRTQSRGPSLEPQSVTQAKPTKASQPKAAQPLFFESDAENDLSDMEEEKGEMQDGGEESDQSTLPTYGRRTQDTGAKTNTRKRSAVLMDDDSDDGFQGFGSRKRARK